MAKRICIACLLFIVALSAAASLRDTTAPYKKITQQEFIERYALDDSSKAVVKYYFGKRKALDLSWILTGSAIVAGTITTIALGNKLRGEQGEPAALRGVVLAIAATLYFITLLPFFIGDLITRFGKFSRKKLFRQLQDYRAGKPLPRTMTRTLLYRKLLQQITNNQ